MAKRKYGKVEWLVQVLDGRGQWQTLDTRYGTPAEALAQIAIVEEMDRTARLQLA